MGMFDSAESLEEAVYLAVGAASVCWDDMEQVGVFDDKQATKIAEDLLSTIRKWMNDVAHTIVDGPGTLPETVKHEDARIRNQRHDRYGNESV